MLPRQSFLADLHEGWREVVSRTWVWVMIVVSSIVNLMGAVFVVLGATISKQALGGAGAWAAIITSLGVGSLVGGLVALRVNPRYPLRFATSLLGWFAVPMVLVGVHAPVALIAATATLGGAGNLAYNTIWETTLQKHVPAHALSRVSAYDWFGSLAFQPLGLLIAGPAAAVLGASETLYLAAGGTVLMVVVAVATPSVRQLQNTPS